MENPEKGEQPTVLPPLATPDSVDVSLPLGPQELSIEVPPYSPVVQTNTTGGSNVQDLGPATLEPWQPYNNAQHQHQQHQLAVATNPAGSVVNPQQGFTGFMHPSTQQPVGSSGIGTVDGVMMTATPPPMVKPWSHDLCGCLEDTHICCKSCWCPCIVYGENAAALGRDCMTMGSLFLLFQYVGLPWVMGMKLRGDIRQTRAIEGDGCNDCLVWACCPLCALTQETQEIKRAQMSAPVITRMNRT